MTDDTALSPVPLGGQAKTEMSGVLQATLLGAGFLEGGPQQSVARQSDEDASLGRPLLLGLVAIFAFLVSTQALIYTSPLIFEAGVVARSVFWALALVVAVISIARRGVAETIDPFIMFMPYFLIGVISALVSIAPIDGLRNLAFWMLSMLAASTVGRGLGEHRTMHLFFWLWTLSMLGSFVLAMASPKLAMDADLRVAGGHAWRGIFVGKNWLGWYAVSALVFACTLKGLRPILRFGAIVLSLVCLYNAHSSGAIVEIVLILGILATFTALWRLPISPLLRVILMLALGSAGLLVILVLGDTVLGLLGRSTTLSGRTSVWSLYLDRALDSWVIGAGPGTYTSLSTVTADIGLSLRGLGIIQTPHNMYIATFGEVGVLGLVARIAPLLYFAVVVPLTNAGSANLAIAGITWLLLLGGLGETHEVFGLGIAMFMIVGLNASRLQTATASSMCHA